MSRNPFATDFPILATAFPDNVVTTGHVDYCRDHGHATHTVDGVDQGVCPRCGAVATLAVTDEPTQAAETLARATGSTSATYVEERVAADGSVVETARATWTRS